MTNGRGCAPPSSLPQRPGCSCHTAISPLFPPISSLLLLLRGWGRGGQPGSGSRTDTRVFFFFFSSSPGPPSGCPVSPASLVRRRLLFLAAAATTSSLPCCCSHYRLLDSATPQGHLRKQPCPITEGAAPLRAGVAQWA